MALIVQRKWKEAKFQAGGFKQIKFPLTFYCDWLPANNQSEKLWKEKVKKEFPNCCFNHRVGLPTLKYEDELERIQFSD